jgi:acetyltransferase-like isoleucine patch superfamily enzyme
LAFGDLAGDGGRGLACGASVVMRAWFNRLRRRLVHAVAFHIVFGESAQGCKLPMTRISPSTCIDHEDKLRLSDHVYIGPFNVIEASQGVTIDEGVQITSHCAIVTHSSHRAQRLLGRAFVTWDGDKPGWIGGPVHIGAYSFIGPHSLIEAGSTLGRGCVVRAGSVVRGQYGDFAVLAGNPAVVVGDTRTLDDAWFESHPEWHDSLKALRAAWADRLAP